METLDRWRHSIVDSDRIGEDTVESMATINA